MLEGLASRDDCELQLVLTASTMIDQFCDVSQVIESDGFTVSRKILSLVQGGSSLAAAKTTGLGLIETASCLEQLQPDLVVTVADRYETLATATAAAYMNVPLAHIQGGEVTGNIDDKVRNAITMLADYHFPSTTGAANRIIRMGADKQKVHCTGCPSIDLARPVFEEESRLPDADIVSRGEGAEIDVNQPYLVVLQHPVTTEVEDSGRNVAETMYAVRDSQIPTFWFWPNPDAGSAHTVSAIRKIRDNEPFPNVRFIKNLDPYNFLRLLKNSQCLVGNSSAGIRECAYLGVPAVNIGGRQANRERGANVIDVEYNRTDILKAIGTQVNHGHYASDCLYGDGQSGKRIADILASVSLADSKSKRLAA